MAAEVAEEPELPEEVTESLETFHEALGKVEDVLKPLLETSVDDLREKMNPVESAKLDLVVAYSINSMFWTSLRINKEAAQRFVKSALWQPSESTKKSEKRKSKATPNSKSSHKKKKKH
ncbi:Nuclear nucleic acid-binding protein C1D [Acropora cervicornis]|uniref:Nuclear nucleic acid-binding protein C1D n=1 Tax=Acropora cervicornis TaxID=6130 RepID=A0AAD9QWT1_ACRCE|nr:Nuclear nucleic acid-binding protein C1D [Acropora cervicornis]